MPAHIQELLSSGSSSEDDSDLSFIGYGYQEDDEDSRVAHSEYSQSQTWTNSRRLPARRFPPNRPNDSLPSEPAAIDLCDETDNEVVEVVPSRDSSESLPPVRVAYPRPVDLSTPDFGRMRELISASSIGASTDVDSIFARIQQHLRSQAVYLGQAGFLNFDTRPRVPAHLVLEKLSVRRVSTLAEAVSLGQCPVCLDPYKPRMQVRVLPGCGHAVHKTCMDKWITKSHRYTCPLDNIPIDLSGQSASRTILTTETVSSSTPGLRRSRRLQVNGDTPRR